MPARHFSDAEHGFHVYKRGRLTVVGFDGRSLNEPGLESRCRDELLALIGNPECQVLVVDLMEVQLVSSWILGILAAIKRQGVEVELYHPSAEIRNILSVTHLDEMLHVRHEEPARRSAQAIATV
jgi:anti-sigma B factor antagonist